MDKRLISTNPVTGVSTYAAFDDAQGTCSIVSEQSPEVVKAILDQNTARRNDGSNGWTETRDMKHVATVPWDVLLLWSTMSGLKMDDPAFGDYVKQRLNDADFMKMRTSEGKV
jgi:hypothetical protein